MTKTKTLFITANVERKIIATAMSNGYSVTPSMGKSPHRHEIELRKGLGSKSKWVYISRSVGVSKGQLKVVISSRTFKNKNDNLLALDGVIAYLNVQSSGQIFKSSNYQGFENKGTLGRGEHWGYGYQLPLNDGLRALSSFFSTVAA